MKILFLHKQILFPHDTGGKIRALNILRHLPRWHDVTYVCNLRPGEEKYIPEMKALGVRLEAVPGETSRRGGIRFGKDLAKNLLSGRPFSVNRNYDPRVRQKVGELIAAENYDILICDCVQMARHVFGQRAKVNILFQHNVEAQILQRHTVSGSSFLRRAYMRRDWRKMQRFESDCGKHFEAVIAVSEPDRAIFRKDYGWQHVHVIDTAVDTEYFNASTKEPKDGHVVFVGSMDWLPNQEGVKWFVSEIWPRIRSACPHASFKVVGRHPTPEITTLSAHPGVEIVGGVPDVRPFLHEAAVSVVPLQIGGGTRLKIFEAMSTGRAVVSTTIGAEGLSVRPREHYLVADDPAQFADEVIRIIQNPDLRSKIGLAGCRYVQQNFGSEPIARQFESICKEVLQSRL